jgi:hypothetical protein
VGGVKASQAATPRGHGKQRDSLPFDLRACGILSLCRLARVQVGRSKNLTPNGDPLFGVNARPVTVVLQKCFVCQKTRCFWGMAVLEQVFRKRPRFINHEEIESLGLTAL